MKSIDLNCDLGEGIGNDAQIMPFISSANIACGYHAGDEETMKQTIELCKKHNVQIGAHPSFKDRENFGRTDQHLHPSEVYDLVTTQINLLKKLAQEAGTRVHHVKPHGALYNMAARNYKIAAVVALAVKDCGDDLYLFGLSGGHMIKEGEKIGLKVMNEVFADRTYSDNGKLTSRNIEGALIEHTDQALAQVLQILRKGTVTTISGLEIPMPADTICIHGDNKHAVMFSEAVYKTLKAEGYHIGSAESRI